MAKLYLIRHSTSAIDAKTPSHSWSLSAQGRAKAKQLATHLKSESIDLIFSSHEPKAIETARYISRALGVTNTVVKGLEEHDRNQVEFLGNDVFRASVKQMFERPTALVFGGETADQARLRFGSTVERLLVEHGGRNIAIVSHGTVMTLFIATFAQIGQFDFWSRLRMPCYSTVEYSPLKLLSTTITFAERSAGDTEAGPQPPSHVSVPDSVLFQTVKDESVLLNLDTELYFSLDAVGTEMWKRLTADGDTESAFSQLADFYDVPEEQLRGDLTRLVSELIESGLLLTEEASTTNGQD